jgi:hypothetical protein
MAHSIPELLIGEKRVPKVNPPKLDIKRICGFPIDPIFGDFMSDLYQCDFR